jgi:glycerol-3-phosphate cytidylyltransferase-like family protein
MYQNQRSQHTQQTQYVFTVVPKQIPSTIPMVQRATHVIWVHGNPPRLALGKHFEKESPNQFSQLLKQLTRLQAMYCNTSIIKIVRATALPMEAGL